MDKRADDETIDIQQLIEAHDWHGLRQVVVSSPFITPLVDVTGLIIYFSIGRLLLGI
jgi:hypothetical protein